MTQKYPLDPENPALSRAVEQALAAALPATQPADGASLRAKLMQRAQATRALHAGSTLVRREQGAWQQFVDGVRAKTLHDGAQGRALLVQFAAGRRMPAHSHREDEECIVLSGHLRLGDLRVGPGDFHVAPGGSRHEPITAETDALIFLRGTPLGGSMLGILRDYLGGFLPGAGTPLHTVPAAQQSWQPLAAGVTRKPLWQRDGVNSALIRLAPGASMPMESLPDGDSELLLVEGEAFCGDMLLRDGDFLHREKGAATLESDVGSLFYLRTA